MRLALISLLMIPLAVGCATKTKQAAAIQATAPLTPMKHEVLDWIDVKACSSYLLGIRMRERGVEGKVKGQRKGILSAGSVIGGSAPDADSAEALYGALSQFPDATFLLAPRYIVHSSGFGIFGTKPFIGRRCSMVSARAIRVISGTN